MCLIVHILALWAWRQTFSISCTFSSFTAAKNSVSVYRQFRVFHQITDDRSNPMDGFGASHSLGLMTSSNSQQPLTSQSGNMLSVKTKGCWMDCKPVWLRSKRLINLLKVNGTNYTLSNEVKHFQGDHRACYVEKLRAYVYLLPPGVFDAVMTISLCHQQRLKLYGTRSEDLQILGASWYFVPGWVQTSNTGTGTGGHRSLLRSLKHFLYIFTSNLNSDPEWCYVQDKQWKVRLETFSPIDVRFLHHRFHSVVELRENHVLREENRGQLFIPTTKISCEQSRKTFWPSAGEGTSAESWLQWNSKIPPKETGWWCPSAKHTANTHQGEAKGLKKF